MLPCRFGSYGARDVKDCLERLHRPLALGALPLASLRVVERRLHWRGGPQSRLDRGVALRQLLCECMRQLQSAAQPHDELDAMYCALHLSYVQREKINAVANKLALGRSSAYRLLDDAVEALTEILFDRERRSAMPVTSPERMWLNGLPLLSPLRFVGRCSDMRELLRRVCLAPPVPHARYIALCGLPGIGKTELLNRMVHEPCVAEAFPDGLLWATLGPSPDLGQILQEWARALDVTDTTGSRDALARRVHAVISSRRILIVLDDARAIEHVQALSVGGPACATVVATCLPVVGAAVAGGQMMRLCGLAASDAAALLAEFAPHVSDLAPAATHDLLTALAGSPGAITQAGRYLQQAALTMQPRRLLQALDRLTVPEFRLVLGDRSDTLAQVSLRAALAGHVAALTDQAQRVLGVLSQLAPAPASFSEITARQLAECSADVLNELVDAGLLETAPADLERLMVPRLVCDYARARLARLDDWQRALAWCCTRVTDGDAASMTPMDGELLIDVATRALRAGLHRAAVLLFCSLPDSHDHAVQAGLRALLFSECVRQDEALRHAVIARLARYTLAAPPVALAQPTDPI